MSVAKESITPMSSIQSLQLHDNSSSTDATQFRQVLGALQYLPLTWPNISYTINKLAQFMHFPTKTHWSTTKQILRYLKATIHHGLFLKRHQKLCVTAFTDVDWEDNRDNRTSTSTYIVHTLSISVVMQFPWCSKKQKIVAHSTTEAEYLASCAAEVVWLKNLLTKLHVNCLSAPQIFGDNCK